jgi:hypothetical protein
MRGYHGLILIDAATRAASRGRCCVNAVHYWPGRVVVVAGEPAEVEEMGVELSPAVQVSVADQAEASEPEPAG